MSASELAAQMKERRKTMGMFKAEAARRSGVARGTWHAIEDGTRPQVSPRTLLAIDRALQWPDGTARTFYEGGGSPMVAPLDFNEALREKEARLTEEARDLAGALAATIEALGQLARLQAARIAEVEAEIEELRRDMDG